MSQASQVRAEGVEALGGGAAVTLDALTKRFGAVTAVDSVDLEIRAGEFFSMLGPSGSGKTTVLRMIAGFERPTSGRVLLAGHDVTGEPPFRRDVNTVFQDYALFPHMSVLQNVEYGLRVKKVPAARRRPRAEEALETVRLRVVRRPPAARSCPVVSGSGSPWPGRWSTGPACCCSTSPSARST